MQTLFLDAAGTLFDLAEPVGAVYARFGAEGGYPITPEEAERRFRAAVVQETAPDYSVGLSGAEVERRWWLQVVRRVFEVSDGERFQEFFASLFDYYEGPEAWSLYPETREFLQEAKERFELVVVSNFDDRLHPILQGLGLRDYFAGVVSSAEARARKPDVRIFQYALGKLARQPEDVLHIGDSRGADYEGALAAGLAAWHLQRDRGENLWTVFTHPGLTT